jgi:hypothetical protein
MIISPITKAKMAGGVWVLVVILLVVLDVMVVLAVLCV